MSSVSHGIGEIIERIRQSIDRAGEIDKKLRQEQSRRSTGILSPAQPQWIPPKHICPGKDEISDMMVKMTRGKVLKKM